MAFRVIDSVLDTFTSTGTGAVTLLGGGTGYRGLNVLADGDKFAYAAFGVDGNGARTGEYESGEGSYASSGTTLTNTKVYDSSNSGSKVSWSSGTKYVVIGPMAQEMKFMPTRTLASDYTNSTTTLSDLTGLSFDAEASADYEVEILGEIQSAVTTTGLGFALTVPTGSTVSGSWDHPQATTQLSTEGYQNASAVVAAKTSGVPAATTSYPCRGRFHVRTSTTAGNVKLQGASEVASSQITVKAGFMFKARRYN